MAEKDKASKEKKKSQKWTLYETKDKLDRKRKSCPKCGKGVFMASHEGRETCGKCGYTEFRKK